MEVASIIRRTEQLLQQLVLWREKHVSDKQFTLLLSLFVGFFSAVAAFVLHWPPVAVFACLKSDQITKCAVAVVKVNRFRWIRDLTREAA